MIQPELQFWSEVRRISVSKVSTLSQVQLDYATVRGSWSVGEVIDHVLKTERFYRSEFEQFISMSKAGKKPVISRGLREVDVGMPFLPKSVMPILGIPLRLINPFVPQSVRNKIIRNRLLKARNPTALTPERGRSREELFSELKSDFVETEALFDENLDLDYTRMIYKHPVIGINTVPQLIRIAALHEQRHQEQIDEIREAAGFPAGGD